MADPNAFMAGVALMDKMLREAERQSEKKVQDFWIEAQYREGSDLTNYLRPLVAELLSRPELVDGFAAALGDFVGSERAGACPGDGWAYASLSYDDIMGFVPQPEEGPVSNVIPLRPPSASSTAGESPHS